jgi:hypothetical protein
VTDERLLALLPTVGVSLGTSGVPECNLVKLAGSRIPGMLRDLEARGLVVQLPGGGWAEARPR